MIVIPECSPPYDNDPYSTIGPDLWSLFDESSRNVEAVSKGDENEWATVSMPSRDKHMANVASTVPSKLPSLSSLGKPENLFSTQIPYQMILQITHNGINVQGSHQPSLQLMKDYFQKYARIDRNDSNMVRAS